MPFVKLNQQLRRLEIKGFEIENDIVFEYFDNIPASDRDDKIFEAIYIGVLALKENRLSSFLSKTANHLGAELESLKIIFDMKKEIFEKTSIKGSLAEEEVAEYLESFVKEKKLQDYIYLTRDKQGALKGNKTGDVVSKVEGNSGQKIAIECKLDKSVKLGDIGGKDIFTKRTYDTAWSQLIETQANRESNVSIIVFDKSTVDKSILKHFEDVGYIPKVGLIAVIHSQKGEYSNLGIAYLLARDIVLNAKEIELDPNLLTILIKRIIKDLKAIHNIEKLILNNIDNNKEILKELKKAMLMMKFNEKYFSKFLEDGTLTKQDLLEFYTGEELKDEFKPLEKEIERL